MVMGSASSFHRVSYAPIAVIGKAQLDLFNLFFNFNVFGFFFFSFSFSYLVVGGVAI